MGNKIAGYGDQIRVQAIHPPDRLEQPGAICPGANMEVADLYETVSFKNRR